VIFAPNHTLVDLQEFNPCHEPDNGRFAVKGAGRCLGVEARKAARAEAAKGKRSLHRRDVTDKQMQAYIADLPAWMRKDAEQAWKADRALVALGTDPFRISHADLATRTATVSPSFPESGFHTKTERLSALRHELGHLDKTLLGRGGQRVLGRTFSDNYVEEIRAWKNAIRNSGGKVDFKTVGFALRSYLQEEPGTIIGKGTILNRHVNLLKRYAKKIRRASKRI
jgi:hypothetical protein